MLESRVLVTGIGGIGGVNFVRALRLAESQAQQNRIFIAGTDFNPFHILFADVDDRTQSPRHSDPGFVPLLSSLINRLKLSFVHPHPSVEARLVAERISEFPDGVKIYMPKPKSISPDKLEIYKKLTESHSKIAVARTRNILSDDELEDAFKNVTEGKGDAAWIRASSGAGGRLGLKVKSPEEAKLWMRLNITQGRARPGDFLLHEFLPGRDIAFDSLWHNGRLLKFYSRERLEYPFKHISLSGITGTPSVARTIRDSRLKEVGLAAILALDKEPHGFFSVDLKEDKDGRLVVTEVDGKWHTTAPLWGYAAAKAFNNSEYNLAYDYVRIGLEGDIVPERDIIEEDFFPENLYLIRQMDSGVMLKDSEKNGQIWRIL